MACDPIYDYHGKVIGIKCGSPWGIGVYQTPDMAEPSYGYPPRHMNPNDFSPDGECCSEREHGAWEEACRMWDELHKTST